MKKLTREQILGLKMSFSVWQQDYDSVHDKGQHDMFALGIAAMNEMLAAIDSQSESQELISKIASLEKALENPVKLPQTNGYWNEKEQAYEEAIILAKRQIRLAGFRVEGDD